MPKGHLEHVNITVSDIDRSAALLERLMGWHIRWRGPSQMGGETIHVGGEQDYIAVYTRGSVAQPFAKGVPLNHVGLVVDDLDAARHFYGTVLGCPEGRSDADWMPALSGSDVVFHLAARVHVMNDIANDPLVAFREVNTVGTLRLARQAAAVGGSPRQHPPRPDR